MGRRRAGPTGPRPGRPGGPDRVAAAPRPGFFTEPLPPAPGWPDAPCGFLRLSPAYDHWLAAAAAQGWPAASLDAGHFQPLADPGGVAAALLGVLARM